MDKKIALKWAKALESGKYKQAKDALSSREKPKEKYGYCCLGVLCDIYAKEMKGGKWKPEYGARYFVIDGDDRNDADLPFAVQCWAGMSSESGDRKEGSSLAQLNDTGTAFKDIAKIIREEWEQL